MNLRFVRFISLLCLILMPGSGYSTETRLKPSDAREKFRGTIADFRLPGFINHRKLKSPLRPYKRIALPLPANLPGVESLPISYDPVLNTDSGVGIGFEIALPRLVFYEDKIFIQNFQAEGVFEEVSFQTVKNLVKPQKPSLAPDKQIKAYHLVNMEYDYFLFQESLYQGSMEKIWRLIKMDGMELLFDQSGHLLKISDKNKNSIDYHWMNHNLIQINHPDWLLQLTYELKHSHLIRATLSEKDGSGSKVYAFAYDTDYLTQISTDKNHVLFQADYAEPENLKESTRKLIKNIYSPWGGVFKFSYDEDVFGVFLSKVETYDREQSLVKTESIEFSSRPEAFGLSTTLISKSEDHLSPESERTVKSQCAFDPRGRSIEETSVTTNHKSEIISSSAKEFVYTPGKIGHLFKIILKEKSGSDPEASEAVYEWQMTHHEDGLPRQIRFTQKNENPETYLSEYTLFESIHVLASSRITKGPKNDPFIRVSYDENANVKELREKNFLAYTATYDSNGRIRQLRDKNQLTHSYSYHGLYPAPVKEETEGKTFYEAGFDFLGHQILQVKNNKNVSYQYGYFDDGFLQSVVRVLPDKSKTVFYNAVRQKAQIKDHIRINHPVVKLSYLGKTIDLNFDSFGLKITATSNDDPELAKTISGQSDLQPEQISMSLQQKSAMSNKVRALNIFPQRNLVDSLPALLRGQPSKKEVKLNWEGRSNFSDEHGSSWEMDCLGFVCETSSDRVKNGDYSWCNASRTYCRGPNYIERINDKGGLTYCAMGGRVLKSCRPDEPASDTDIFLRSDADGDDLRMSYIIGQTGKTLFTKKLTYNYFNKLSYLDGVISSTDMEYDDYEILQNQHLSLDSGKKFTYQYKNETSLQSIRPLIPGIERNKHDLITDVNFDSGLSLKLIYDDKHQIESLQYKTKSGQSVFSQAIDRNKNGSVISLEETTLSSDQKRTYEFDYDQNGELISAKPATSAERDEDGQVIQLEKSSKDPFLNFGWQDEMLKTIIVQEGSGHIFHHYYDENETLLASCPANSKGLASDNPECFIRYSENSFSYLGHKVHLIKANGLPLAVSIDGQEYPLIVDQRGSVVGMLSSDLKPVWTRQFDEWGFKSVNYFDDWSESASKEINLSASRTLEQLTIWSFARLIENPVSSQVLSDIGYPLYWSKSRVYAPGLREWLSVDPLMKWNPQLLAQTPVNWHPFKYVANDPMSHFDESGYFAHIVVAAIVVGTVNSIVQGQKDGQYLKHFVVGAIVGAASAATAGALTGAEGVFAAQIAAGGGSGLAASIIAGGAIGFTSGFVQATTTQLVFQNRVDFKQSLEAGGRGMVTGAISGAVGQVLGLQGNFYQNESGPLLRVPTDATLAQEVMINVARMKLTMVSSIITSLIMNGQASVDESFLRDEAISFAQSAMISYFNDKYEPKQKTVSQKTLDAEKAEIHYANNDIRSTQSSVSVPDEQPPSEFEAIVAKNLYRKNDPVQIIPDKDLKLGYKPRPDEKLVIKSENSRGESVLIKVEPSVSGNKTTQDKGLPPDTLIVAAHLLETVGSSRIETRGELVQQYNAAKEEIQDLTGLDRERSSYRDTAKNINIEYITQDELTLIDFALDHLEDIQSLNNSMAIFGQQGLEDRAAAIDRFAKGIEDKFVEIGNEVVDRAVKGATQLYHDFCFPEDTLILVKTEDGVAHKKISEITTDDMVVSCNTLENSCEIKPVIKTGSRQIDQLVHINYVALKNSDEADEVLNELPKSLQDLKVNSIRSTPDHPFYINKSLDETVAAENILTGELLYSISDSQDDDSEGPVFLVVNVSHIDTEEPVTVYNISVEGNHNYYVSSHDVLVHNCNDPLDTAAKQLTPYGTFLEGVEEYELMVQSARDRTHLKTQYHSMKLVALGISFIGQVASLGTASPIVSIFKGSSKKGVEVAIKGGAESAIKHMGKNAPQKTVKIANTSTALSKHIQSDAASAIRDQLSKSQAAKLGHKPPSGGWNSNSSTAGIKKYDVGSYNELRGKVPGLDAHHAGQKAVMKKLVDGYNPSSAPSILVPKIGHTIKGPRGIVSRKTAGIENARALVARDINELRRVYPDLPNVQLQKLIDLNKRLYPNAFLKE